MWLKKLIAAFIKQNGRKPNAIETLQLKFKAKEKGWTPKVIAGGKSPKKWTDKSGQQWIQDGDGPPVQITEGIGIFDTPYKRMKFDADMKRSLREFTRREDLYEGLPSALRNVKNPEEVKKLLDSGAIKIGKAPKTKKTKAPVDPKFKRAVESQDEHARLIREFEQRNKDSAFNFAFKKYKDIDRKPMELDEVVSIYTNLNKYPKGRNIIVDDIADIERRHILPNIGNRSREMLVNKLNKMIRPKKQPNPFKKAPELKKGEQIEMDFIDWDPKGMAGGGLAYMLGEPSRKGFADGYSVQDDMTDYAENVGREASPGGGFEDSGNGNNEPTGDNNKPWYNKPSVKAASFMVNPIGATIVGGAKSLYDQYMKDKAIGTNITDAALSGSQYFGDTTSKMQRDYRKTTGLKSPDDPPRDEGGNETVPWIYPQQQAASLGIEGIAPKDDFDLYAVVEGREPSRFYADGGRIGFDKGGFNKGRRNFMKLMAGLASIPVVGKLFKGAKVASKIAPLKNTTTHMPAWFPDFVDKVMAKGVGKRIDADIVQYEVKELPNIKMTRHDDGSVFVEGQNDYSRSYDIEYRPPGYEVVDYQTGKTVKTKGDFTASEEVPVSMDMDGNTDFEGEILEEVGDILTSDGRKLEEFATGKKIKGSTRGEHRVGQAEVAAENAADEAAERAAMEADDFAKGGLAHMLGE